ncbi:MAG: Lrp/AsnC family transcriptional regulator [Desulfonatronovibrionaceae bacterium]
MLDEKDLQILNIIQGNSRVTNAEIARQVGMAPSGMLERVRRLEKKGIIRGYEARMDAGKLGLVLTVFIMIKTEEGVGSTRIGNALAAKSEVQEVYFIAGEYNYQLKARVRDTEHLAGLLKSFGAIPGVRDSRTTLVLESIKETLKLPIPDGKVVNSFDRGKDFNTQEE